MPPTVDLTIAPNEKYSRVIAPEHDHIGVGTAPEDWPDDHEKAANIFADVVADAPKPQDVGMDPDGVDVLAWDMMSVSSDPDLVAKMATYFEGIDADGPTDLIRAKLRLVNVETYANVQFAAQNELRNE